MFTNARCNKTGLHCANSVFSFELPVKAIPYTDSILVGDSIKFVISESTMFREVNTGQFVDFNGAANLGSAIGFQQYDSATKNWLDAASLFSYTLLEGKRVSERNPALYREFIFQEKNERYVFELIIIPKNTGLYIVGFSNSASTYRYSDPCTKAGFVINFKETNHNRHLVGYVGEDLPGGDFYFHVGE